jgi:hypothetical protein
VCVMAEKSPVLSHLPPRCRLFLAYSNTGPAVADPVFGKA